MNLMCRALSMQLQALAKNMHLKGTCEKMLVACQIKVIGLDCTSSKRNLASYTSFER